MNLELHPLRLSWVSSHPNNLKTRFVDGALVGALLGHSSPKKKGGGNFTRHEID